MTKRIGRSTKRLLVVFAALAGLSSFALPIDAWAISGPNAVNTVPSSGTGSTAFQLAPDSSTAALVCPLATGQPGGDVLDSFVVDGDIAPFSSLGGLTFTNGMPVFGTYQGVSLVAASGGTYVNESTLTTGAAPPGVQFSWGSYENTANYGPQLPLHDGVFNVGIACVTPTGAIDNNHFWSAQVTFVSAATNTPPFNWASAAVTTPPISASPASVTFPTTAAGSTSDPVTITITASSATSIGAPYINAAEDSADYAVIGGTCTQGLALAIGQSCSFEVQYQPTVVSPPNSFVIVDYGPAGAPTSGGGITIGLGNPANPPIALPEVGLAILMPLGFLILLGAVVLWRRRHRGMANEGAV